MPSRVTVMTVSIFLNLQLDRTWPAFLREKQVYVFYWGAEGK